MNMKILIHVLAFALFVSCGKTKVKTKKEEKPVIIEKNAPKTEIDSVKAWLQLKCSRFEEYSNCLRTVFLKKYEPTFIEDRYQCSQNILMRSLDELYKLRSEKTWKIEVQMVGIDVKYGSQSLSCDENNSSFDKQMDCMINVRDGYLKEFKETFCQFSQ